MENAKVVKCTLDITGVGPVAFYVHNSARDFISYSIVKRGYWERFTTYLSIELLKARPGGFIDIGGNVGWYSVVVGKAAGPGCPVHVFEPEPANFRILQQNITANGLTHVTAENMALSDRETTLSLFQATENLGDHRLWEDAGENRARVTVRAMPLDGYFGDTIPDVSLVKIDVQGAELDVLRGMRRVLDANAEHFVMLIEYWPDGMLKYSGSLDEFAAFLERYGLIGVIAEQKSNRLHPVSRDYLMKVLTPESLQPGAVPHLDIFLLNERSTRLDPFRTFMSAPDSVHLI